MNTRSVGFRQLAKHLMRTFAKTKALLVIGLLCMTAVLPLRGATAIYDNRVNDLTTRYNTGLLEIGDEIGLAGTERYLTHFSFEFWGTNTAKPDNSSFAGDVEARVKLYVNNGTTDANLHIRPRDVLYDSKWVIPSGFGPTARSTMVFLAGSGLGQRRAITPHR